MVCEKCGKEQTRLRVVNGGLFCRDCAPRVHFRGAAPFTLYDSFSRLPGMRKATVAHINDINSRRIVKEGGVQKVVRDGC